MRYAYYDRDADITWFPTGHSDDVVRSEVWNASTRLPASLLNALPAPIPARDAAA